MKFVGKKTTETLSLFFILLKHSYLSLGIFYVTASISMAQTTYNFPESSDQMLGRSLEDFFSAATEFSPRLKIAKERLNIGSAQRSIANSRLLPQLRANANLSDNTRTALGQKQVFDGNRYSVQFSQVLFNWQAFTERSQAYLREDIAEISYYDELSNVLTDVAEKYFNALQARDALQSISSELDAVQRQLAQIEQLYARQLALITDLSQAQASVAAIESQKSQLESQLTIEIEILQAASGIRAGDLFRLQQTIELPRMTESLNYWMTAAKDNNHIIRIRKLEVIAAGKAISQRQGAYMPQLSLIVQRQDSNVGFDNMPITRSDNTYFGIDISVPLYAGGGNRAGVREAISEREIAANKLKQAELEISTLVRTAFSRASAGESIIGAAQKFVDSSRLNAAAAERGFELGAITSVDVLNALRNQYQAERDFQKVRYEHIKFLLQLKREAGTLAAEDLLEISAWLSP